MQTQGFFMTIKKILVSLLLFTSICRADNPIILWDIHGVLLQTQDRALTFFTFPHLKEVFSHFSWPLLKDFASLSAQHLFQDTSSEEYIKTALKHGNPHLAELIISIANAQRPIPGMKELVQELHALGVEQHIGSNIGETSFRRLLDSNKHPYVAPFFKRMDLKKSIVTGFENGEIIKKPDARFFEKYLAHNAIELDKTPVLFIDDNWDNVRVARSMGFDAILFKNPQQLRKELRARNIPIKAPHQIYSTQRDAHKLHPPFSFYRVIPAANQ